MKILIIRFSSFGDVLQTLSVAGRLHASFPASEIHWVTRTEFLPLIEHHPHVHKVWTLEPAGGWPALRSLGRELKAQRFTHVYDAHNNLRSRLLCWQLNGFLRWRVVLGRARFLRRSIFRWRRFLLFRLRWNLFSQPFSGQGALLAPLARWAVPVTAPPVPQLFLAQESGHRMRSRLGPERFVALAPSAAFALKRWPLEHWQELIRACPQTHFVLLGGPQDSFLQQLVSVAPERVRNLAGQLSLIESADVVALSMALVSNDTGLMHVAEQLGKPCLALMGPAPFGFPSRPRTEIFEVKLHCRPCSKHGQGPCVNPELQKCLRDIPPPLVARALKRLIDAEMAAPLSHP